MKRKRTFRKKKKKKPPRYLRKRKVKRVKQSLYSPGQALRVPGV
jgi:hypothetical protein